MCPPQPTQMLNVCFTKPAVTALIIGAIAILIGLVICFLIVRVKNKKLAHYTLLAFLLSSIITSPVIGISVILSPNPAITILLLRLLMIINALMIVFWYTFISDFLQIKNKWALYISGLILIALSLFVIIDPYFVLSKIVWSQQLGWYDFVFVNNLSVSLLPFLPLFLPHIIGIIYLVLHYRQTRSPIQRNRIKYLALASGIFMSGWALYLAPIQSFRYIPVDAIAAVITGAILTYTVLRFRLLDISVIIRKGLLYTTLTTVVTGVYILFAFIVQALSGISPQPASIASAITTAIFVAFIFQPLQNITQSLIDKVFFRKRYNSNLLISQFSEAIASTIERDKLASTIVNLICNTIQIDKAFLLLADDNLKKYHPVYTKFFKNKDQLKLNSAHKIIKALQSNKEVIGYYDNIDSSYANWMKDKSVELIVPLISKDRLLGLIGLGPKLSEEEYSIEEYALLNSLGNQAAIAFENSNLLETVRREKKAVEKAYEREKELDKQKSEFVAITSHNLRTPLTIASGYIDMMLSNKTKYAGEDQEKLQTIYDALGRLSVITENLLIISQAEAKEKIFRFKEENIIDLTDEIVKIYEPLARDKSLNIEYEKSEIKNPNMVFDRSKLKLAISNLLDNAVKFTEKGNIKVRVLQNNGFIEIKISDTGKGIPKENIPDLFTKFFQGKKNPHEFTPGIGSGLYITKLIVEAHNGIVDVESAIDQGSTFTLKIPLDLKATPDIPPHKDTVKT